MYTGKEGKKGISSGTNGIYARKTQTNLNPHDSLRLNKVRRMRRIINASPLISEPRPMSRSSRNDDIIDHRVFIYGNRIRWDVELRDLTISLHYREDIRVQLYPQISEIQTVVETLHTPASINGLDIHSFHQNCLSTRRHNGNVGLGSIKGENFPTSIGP